MPNVIRLGDATSHGGKVESVSATHFTVDGVPVACVGDACSCPSIEITSSKRIVLTATDEIVLQAPKVRIVAQGAQVDIGAGVITQQSSGEHTIKSSKFAHVGPGGGSPAAVTLPKSEGQHDQQTMLRWTGTDEPMKNQRYRIITEDGRTFEGRTDANGLTERFSSAISFGRYSIEALDD